MSVDDAGALAALGLTPSEVLDLPTGDAVILRSTLTEQRKDGGA